MYPTPDKVFEELFIDLNRSGIWADVKPLADATPKSSPANILEKYRTEKEQADFDLKAFFEQHFEVFNGETGFESDTSKPVHQHIEILWDFLKRSPEKKVEGSSLIPLPNEYIVPGGRFNEIYYWDSYFTMLGLQVSGKVDLIESMIDNFSWMIGEIGFIPNGNRSYFLSRSQPPFYALMVSLLAEEKGQSVLGKYLPFLEKEYAFWMNGKDKIELENFEHVVHLGNNKVLNRYYDRSPELRAEMYANDLHSTQSTNRNPTELFLDLRAACESGWDFSSRWLRDYDDLESIHTSEILPVDLNCLLYNLEKTISKAHSIAGNLEASNLYLNLAKERKQLIYQYFWNEETGFFHDYDFVKKEQTEIISMAGAFPLFFEIANPNQAKRSATVLEKKLLKSGGFVTTSIHTKEQWDAPNGWAPLQWIGIKGLQNYGFIDLADQARENWCKLNIQVFHRTGRLLEKYNVEDTSILSGGGEYDVQDGFGWTNGVLLRLLSE